MNTVEVLHDAELDNNTPIKLNDKSMDVSSDTETATFSRHDDETTYYDSSNDGRDLSDVSSGQDDYNSDASRRKTRNSLKEGEGYWSQGARSELLLAIKKYGMLNVELLAKVIDKDESQIKAFFANAQRTLRNEHLKKAKERAEDKLTKELESQLQERQGKSKQRKTKKDQPYDPRQWAKTLQSEMGDAPIDWWLDLMETNMNTMMNHLQKRKRVRERATAVCEMLPRALLAISKYENHPDPSLCAGVNYKDAYEYLSHMLSGVPGKTLNPPTAKFIRKSISKLRFAMLEGLYSPEYRKHFGAQQKHVWSASKKTMKFDSRTYGKGSNVDKLTSLLTNTSRMPVPDEAMRGLLNIPSFNIMNVPETLLPMLFEASTEDNTSVPQSELEPFTEPISSLDIDDKCVGIFSETDFYTGGSMKLSY